MTRHTRKSAGRRASKQAIVLTDYQDLHAYISIYHGSPLLVITELLDSARRHLKSSFDLDAVHISAYADFSALDEDGINVQRRLHEYGFDARFVFETDEDHSTEMQLCIDATQALHTHDAETFVLVTASRRYLPLVHHLRRHGRRVIVLSLMPHPDDEFFDEGITYENALDLFGPTIRGRLAPLDQDGQAASTNHRDGQYAPPAERPPHSRVTSDGLIQALRIIEEFFGQYEEVYLTPLLRKLSELMDEERYDPKDLVSGLEEAGAVWLEKRPAHPHDYTVLLVDGEHPDVIAVREEYQEHPEETEDPYYYDDGQPADGTEPYDSDTDDTQESYGEAVHEDGAPSERTSDEMMDDSMDDDYSEQRFTD